MQGGKGRGIACCFGFHRKVSVYGSGRIWSSRRKSQLFGGNFKEPVWSDRNRGWQDCGGIRWQTGGITFAGRAGQKWNFKTGRSGSNWSIVTDRPCERISWQIKSALWEKIFSGCSPVSDDCFWGNGGSDICRNFPVVCRKRANYSGIVFPAGFVPLFDRVSFLPWECVRIIERRIQGQPAKCISQCIFWNGQKLADDAGSSTAGWEIEGRFTWTGRIIVYLCQSGSLADRAQWWQRFFYYGRSRKEYSGKDLYALSGGAHVWQNPSGKKSFSGTLFCDQYYCEDDGTTESRTETGRSVVSLWRQCYTKSCESAGNAGRKGYCRWNNTDDW